MEIFKKIMTFLLTATTTLAICFIILCSCVKLGMKIFGVEAFAVSTPDIQKPCEMSTEEFEAVLKGELKQYAQAFLNAEEDYGINACFLASIAAAESGWGEHQFRKNNIFGFGKIEFDSVEHGIDYVAWYIRKNYIMPEGKYFRGGTIEDIGKVWCPDGTGDWERLVTGIYSRMCKEVQ